MHRSLERVGDTHGNTKILLDVNCDVVHDTVHGNIYRLLTAVVATPQHNPARARDATPDECGRLPDELCEVARSSRECRLGEIVHVDLVVPHLCHLLDCVARSRLSCVGWARGNTFPLLLPRWKKIHALFGLDRVRHALSPAWRPDRRHADHL